MFDIVPKILLLEKMNLLKQIEFFLVLNIQNWQKQYYQILEF